MWKAIKETLPSDHNGINAIYAEGKLQTDPRGIAEVLNDHFSSIGRKLAKAFAGVIPNQCDAAAETSTFVLQPVTVA